MTYFITRAVLNKNAPEHALKPLLDPENVNFALDAHHRLMWTLFPSKKAQRDFLWRSAEHGKFYILSAREPNPSRLFAPMECKPFAPILRAGNKLQFLLRVNATTDRRSSHSEGVKPGTDRFPSKDRRVDIVMHAMLKQSVRQKTTGNDSRATRRLEIAQLAAMEWMVQRSLRWGFVVDQLTVEKYRVAKLKRKGNSQATIGIIDLIGTLTIHDPQSLFNQLVKGFGRAKAFGCGLMLIRPCR